LETTDQDDDRTQIKQGHKYQHRFRHIQVHDSQPCGVPERQVCGKPNITAHFSITRSYEERHRQDTQGDVSGCHHGFGHELAEKVQAGAYNVAVMPKAARGIFGPVHPRREGHKYTEQSQPASRVQVDSIMETHGNKAPQRCVAQYARVLLDRDGATHRLFFYWQ